jgi:filamentous hemagglutinin
MSLPDRCKRPGAAFLAGRERPWVRAVARALAALLVCQPVLLAAPAFAQIAARRDAPVGQRPILDGAQNGVPIAHIAPPSRGGVSRNQYEQFNVDKRGLILNNSAAPVQSRQGGWISGNLQLQPGAQPARIILNEVTGAGASQLRGTIEVAGSRADIVVANPNGLVCDGCGFLNAGRASLVTGRAQSGNDGALAGFDVRQGQLSVGAGGLNAANLEQLDLIARGIVLEGEVWATNLNMISGANQVLYGTLQATTQAGDGAAPRFAVDIRELGAMVGNQVYLLASERGVGVNSTGRMAALQGNLVLSANGDLRLNDSYARQAVQVDGAGDVSLAGRTQGDTLKVVAAGTLGNAGVIEAAGRLALQGGALANTGTITQHDSAGATLRAAGQFSNSGSIRSAGVLDIGAADIADTGGALQSTGELRLQAGAVSLSGTLLASDATVRMAAIGGRLVAAGTRVRAASVDADAAGALKASGSDWQVTGAADLRGASVANRGGSVLANGRLTILSGGAVDNSGGSLQAVTGLALTGRSLANGGGLVASDGNVTVRADAGVDTRHGTLSAGGSLEVLARSGTVDNSAGKMLAANGVTVAAGRLVNDGGSIVAGGEQGGALTVNADALSNRQGTIDAAATLAVTSAGAVDNTAGAMLAATGSARITAGSLDNAGGRIVSRDALAIVTNALDNKNAGTIASTAGTVAIDAARTDNLGGKISGAGAVTVNSLAFDNTRGELSSGTDLRLDTHGHALTNRDGTLLGMGNVTVRAGAIDNSAQAAETRIVAGGTLDVVADSLANDRGLLSGALGATVAVGSGLLRNQHGTIESGAALALAAGMLEGQGGHIGATDTVTITAASVNVADGSIDAGKAIDITSAGLLDNRRGNIVSDGRTSLNAASLMNAGGVVSALERTDVRLGAGFLDNSVGSLLGGEVLTVQSGEIRNAAGIISTASALTLDTGNRLLDNSDGGQILSGGTLVLNSGRFVNKDGTAASTEGELHVTTNGQSLDNDRGKLQAKKGVTLETGALTNRDGLVSGQRLVLDNSTLDNDRGKVLAEGALDIDSRAPGGVLSNDRGLLQAGGALTIAIGAQALVNTASGDAAGIVAGGKLNVTAGSLDNRAGFIGSKDSQVVTLSGDLDNQVLEGKGGQIASNAGSTIRAGRVFNQGGRIDALGDAAVTAGLLDNGGGAIAANRGVTLAVGTLDNRARNGVVASIDGASITATATVIDNRGGAMRAAGDATLTADSLDNRGGELNAAGVLRVASATLVNDGGSIVGDGGVVVTTGSRSPGGAIASQRDVTLDIQGDYINTGLLSAQKNLTVNATNITNSGTLTAGDTLTANTGNLDNSGEISAPTTLLNLSGTLTNTVTGLVNGGNTRINAAKVDNAGRIYGDLLRIDAGKLSNRGTGVLAARDTLLAGVKDLSNTEGGLIYSLGELGVGGAFDPTGKLQGAAQSLLNASSRIEAAGRMAIYADSVVNRNDAISTRLVTGAPVASEFVQPRNSSSRYPLAQCFGIGGNQANNACIVHPDKYGQRSVVTPVYSQFISSYDLHTGEPIYGTSVNYTWGSPIFAQYHVDIPSSAPPAEPASGCMSVDQLTGASSLLDTPQCRIWATDREAWNIAFSESLTELDGKVNAYNASVNEDNRLDIFEDYTWYKVNSTSTNTEIVSSAPGQILSGDGMLLSGSVTNRDSQIVAGGALTVVGPDVRNIAMQGMTRVEQQGTSMFTERVPSGTFGTSTKRVFKDPRPYNPAPVVTMTDLPTVRFETLAGQQTSVRDLDVATRGADSSTAGNAQAASRGRDTVSTFGIDAVMSNGPTARTVRPAVPVVQRVAASGSGVRANDVILTTPPVLTIPASALFVLHPEPASRTLVETDPRFTSYRAFISSDYFQQVLKRDPEHS